MAIFHRLQRWLEDPLRTELELSRRREAVLLERLDTAKGVIRDLRTELGAAQRQATEALALVGQMKRQGFAAEPALDRPAVLPMSEEENQLWEAIWRRAPRGSGLAADLYTYAQQQLTADRPIEEVIGTILEGSEIDVLDEEELG